MKCTKRGFLSLGLHGKAEENHPTVIFQELQDRKVGFALRMHLQSYPYATVRLLPYFYVLTTSLLLLDIQRNLHFAQQKCKARMWICPSTVLLACASVLDPHTVPLLQTSSHFSL